MKILMVGRIELLDVGGGDKVQIQNTAAELEKLGISIDIKTGLDLDFSGYDIIHAFQLDWTPETYFYAKKAKELGKPFVLSPIHHSVEELKRFDDGYVFGFRRLSRLLFKNQYARDTFKNVYRALFDLRKLKPTWFSVLMGLKTMQRKALAYADVVLVQTEAEAQALNKTYGVDIKWEKVPNGVGNHFRDVTKFENRFDFSDYILCVGRIEPRKNQLNIIKAVELFRKSANEDVPLVFVGSKNTKHFEYLSRFYELVDQKDWITYAGRIAYAEIPALYKFAKVGVSASWFETTGLTSLEALFCKTNAVAAGNRAKEYLGDFASYCDPGDVVSIKAAIEKEYFANRPEINHEMLSSYTWENAAKKTATIYKRILKERV